MGFFGATTSAISTASIEDLLNDDSLDIKEGLGLMEAGYAYAAETEMNWNAIMEAAAMTELQHYSSTGEEYTYTNESGFFESIVNFFKKIWEKIKSLFKKFMVMLGSLVGKDKTFIQKHKKTIQDAMKNIPSDAEIKGYKFTYEELHARITKAGDSLKTQLTSIQVNDKNVTTGSLPGNINLTSDSFDTGDALEIIRGDIMKNAKGATTNMTDSEMREVAFAECRDGEDSPIDIKIDPAAVGRAIAELDGGDKAKSDALKLYKKTEDIFKTAMKDVEKKEKEYYSANKSIDNNDTAYNNGTKSLSRGLSLAKSTASMIQTLCTVYLQAVKDKYSQDRKICVKVVTYKTVKNEGAYVSHMSEGGYFAGVNLM